MIKRILGYTIMTLVVLAMLACLVIGFHTWQSLAALGLAIVVFVGITGLWYLGKHLADL